MMVPACWRFLSYPQLISPGDVMRGHVVSKRSYGVIVRLTSSQDSRIVRELSDINIKVLWARHPTYSQW